MKDLVAAILYAVAFAAAFLQLLTYTLSEKQAEAAELAALKVWDKLDDWKKVSAVDWIKSPPGTVALALCVVLVLIMLVSARPGTMQAPVIMAVVLAVAYCIFPGGRIVALSIKRPYFVGAILGAILLVLLFFFGDSRMANASFLGYLIFYVFVANMYLWLIGWAHEFVGRGVKSILLVLEPAVRWAAELKGGILYGLAGLLGAIATFLKSI